MSVPTFSRIRQARELPGSLVSFIALWLVISSGVTFGVDIITGGKTYRSVEVVSINGDTVTFTSRQGEISVSRKKLSWVEEAKVAEYEKKVSGRNPHEELRDDSLDPRKMQRVWVSWSGRSTERERHHRQLLAVFHPVQIFAFGCQRKPRMERRS